MGLFQVKYLKDSLEEDIKNNKLVIMMNDHQSCLCLVYGNEDYYVYGECSKDILSGVRFANSRNSDDCSVGIFVSKSKVEQSDELKQIFGKAAEHQIVSLDYDMHIDGH